MCVYQVEPFPWEVIRMVESYQGNKKIKKIEAILKRKNACHKADYTAEAERAGYNKRK